MPKSCAVPSCDTGRKATEKCSVFKVPSNPEMRRKWIAAIPGISHLSSSQFICEKHFHKHQVRRRWVTYSEGRIIAEAPYARAQLDRSAVPVIFDTLSDTNVNSSVNPSIEQDMSVDHNYCSISKSSSDEPQCHIPMNAPTETAVAHTDDRVATLVDTPMDTPSMGSATDVAYDDMERASLCQDMEIDESAPAVIEFAEEEQGETPATQNCQLHCSFEFSDVTFSCTTGGTTVSTAIPQPWAVQKLVADNGNFLFSYAVTKKENGDNVPVYERSVKLQLNGRLSYYVYGRTVDVNDTSLPSVMVTIESLPQTLQSFKNMNLCNGIGTGNDQNLSSDRVFKDSTNRWRDKNCTLISKRKRCHSCLKTRTAAIRKDARSKTKEGLKRIGRACNPIDQRKLIALRKRTIHERRMKRRAEARIGFLEQRLQETADEISSIRSETLADRCAKLEIPMAQQTVLRQIIAAAGKADGKNRRYGEQWIMLCLLMNIRSPSTYEFLRKNNVLPLPSSRTIRNYFSSISMKCGFDEDFAKLLTKHFEKKTVLQRQGVLLLDEINLRKSVAVCSKNLTYVGLTDLGEDGPQSSDLEDQATHGLVLMFQPLADSYTQPIAVFASKNPVKGEELAKIVMKAISYLERTGAKIHGVISDGASTNAKMWSLLGISGGMEDLKTWFVHPTDESRKVFVFSDMPHVMKNIRNRLYNKKKLRIKSSKNFVEWKHIVELFNLDTQHAGNARVCPKLTQRHVTLDNTSKMRVRLATQVFSNSVVHGLRFYQSHNPEGPLKECGETIEFCQRMNDMFDAMNRKSPNQGLIPGNDDFKMLEDSLEWLNEWETSMKKGDIAAEEYLTPETSKALRVSLRSTLDMCIYLTEKFGFQYLLTGKVNQDNLEKFFGTIRQAAGCNDHPNAPTFLQLYKLLSVYSILKPPKYGNCTVSGQHSPQLLITLEDIKAIYGQKPESKFSKYREELQAKLDRILEQQDWEADDVIEINRDHDYSLSPILDCIIYYVTGYLCKQVLKMYSDCMICQEAIKSDSSTTASVSQLVDLKSRGRLIHANLRFFSLIRHVETCFAKHSSRSDVFNRTLDEVLETFQFTFPCADHASSILSYSIIYYIRLRMRQSAHQENLKATKKFVVKKKLSKLTNQ